jgi:hypothetical protein
VLLLLTVDLFHIFYSVFLLFIVLTGERKSPKQRGVYEFLRGKILDVFPDYEKEAEDHLSKAVCSTKLTILFIQFLG